MAAPICSAEEGAGAGFDDGHSCARPNGLDFGRGQPTMGSPYVGSHLRRELTRDLGSAAGGTKRLADGGADILAALRHDPCDEAPRERRVVCLVARDLLERSPNRRVRRASELLLGEQRSLRLADASLDHGSDCGRYEVAARRCAPRRECTRSHRHAGEPARDLEG
jgi:hypothetical protein